MSSGVVWVIIASGLVLLMTPAVGLFYGGLVRQKNVLSTIMYSFFTLTLVSVLWVMIGYTLSFGPTAAGLIGGLDYLGLRGVEAAAAPADGPRSLAFMFFQLTFAAITPALISGAFVERKKFGTFVLFTALWSLLVYTPVAHWVWGGGWLSTLNLFGGSGVLDFAGGKVVHITSGVSALVCALIIGPRSGFRVESMTPHNPILTVLGASLLWFGWFGFNGGSALDMNAQAVHAIVTTNTAAAAAALVWVGLAWATHKKPSVIAAAVGAVAGLVAITPGAGYVSVMASVVIGVAVGALCYFVTEFVLRGRVDDALDVFGVHGVGGIGGAVLTAVFASPGVPGNTKSGLLAGDAGQFGRQVVAVLIVALYAGLVTAVILKLLQATVGVRVSAGDEVAGLDLSQHGESVGEPAVSPIPRPHQAEVARA